MAMNNCCAEPTLSCPRWPPTWPDPSCDCLNGDLNGDGQVTWRDLDLYVASQNTSGGAVYLWDAENRLIEYRPLIPVAGSRKVTFAYDYQGRRVAKRVYNWSGGEWVADPLEERRFVWHEWLMLEELGGPSGAGQGGTGYQPVRSYTWGLDLAGLNGSVNSLQAAGGIGGLLAVHQAALDRPGEGNDVAAGDYGFTYDGNGNVVQVVNVSDYGVGNFWWQAVRTMAVYEYDAYGNVIGPDTNADGQFDELDNVGAYAAENPMRFSTKCFDDETGLGNWGYRYYSPALGRWVSRDPLEEVGFTLVRRGTGATELAATDPAAESSTSSANDYRSFENAAPQWIDPDGRLSLAGPRASQSADAPTCVIQLRCDTIPRTFGAKHCEYQISSRNGSGTCTCGQASCPPGPRLCCIWGGTCLGCTWTGFSGKTPFPGYGTVVQAGIYPESKCDCLRRWCQAMTNMPVCYKTLYDNCNSAASWINSGCGLGFVRPSGAVGWDN